MSDSEERRELIEELDRFPCELEAAVADLTEAQLDTPYRSGGWTVRQVVHHLADAHVNGYVRMKLALTEGFPILRRYEQEPWAELPDASLPVVVSLSIVTHLHRRWVALLRALPDEAFARLAYHPETGDLNVERLLRIYVEHGRNHLAQIGRVRRNSGD